MLHSNASAMAGSFSASGYLPGSSQALTAGPVTPTLLPSSALLRPARSRSFVMLSVLTPPSKRDNLILLTVSVLPGRLPLMWFYYKSNFYEMQEENRKYKNIVTFI